MTSRSKYCSNVDKWYPIKRATLKLFEASRGSQGLCSSRPRLKCEARQIPSMRSTDFRGRSITQACSVCKRPSSGTHSTHALPKYNLRASHPIPISQCRKNLRHNVTVAGLFGPDRRARPTNTHAHSPPAFGSSPMHDHRRRARQVGVILRVL